MINFLEFIFFSIAILVSNSILHISRTSTEKRTGLINRPLLLLVRAIPEYINEILVIIILFIAVKISHEAAFASLVMIFATKISRSDKSYGYNMFDAVCALCVLSSTITVMMFDNSTYIMTNSPFLFLSFIVSTVSITLFNDNSTERPVADISRSLALNIYLISIFTPLHNFGIMIIAGILMIYLQFLIGQLTPRFSVFQNIRYSFGILSFLSLLAVAGSIICALY